MTTTPLLLGPHPTATDLITKARETLTLPAEFDADVDRTERDLVDAAEAHMNISFSGPDAWLYPNGSYAPPGGWPWADGDWDPSEDTLENLIIAAALLETAIARLLKKNQAQDEADYAESVKLLATRIRRAAERANSDAVLLEL